MIKIKFKDGNFKIKAEGGRSEIVAEALIILLRLPESIEEACPGAIKVIERMIDRGEVDEIWKLMKEEEAHAR